MTLKIRLARSGAKKQPYYRIVVADVRAPRDGRYIEKLGFYNPLIASDHKISEKEQQAGRLRLQLDDERIKHWLAQGAQPTDRVLRFLEEAKILDSQTKRNNPNKAKPKAKAQQRAQDAIDKAKAAEAEAAEAAAAPKEEDKENEAEAAEAEAAEAEAPKAEVAEPEAETAEAEAAPKAEAPEAEVETEAPEAETAEAEAAPKAEAEAPEPEAETEDSPKQDDEKAE